MTQMYPPQAYPPAQYPQQPTYPPGPQFQQPPAQYPQQPAYTQPQQFPMAQGYPPVQMAPPAAPLVQGSIDDFFNQPSTGGGKSLNFDQVGTRYIGIVARPLGQGDVQQQTDTQQRPLFFKDGRPKFVMKVPLQMQPSAAYPDGLATWFVKGAARDELVRAMAEAGAPAGPPEAGAIIDITHTGTRPSGVGMNPAKLFAVTYRRPDGSAPVAAAPPQQFQAPAQPDPRLDLNAMQAAAQQGMPAQVAFTPDPQLSAYAQAVQPELAAMQAAQQAQFAQQGFPQQPAGQYPPAQPHPAAAAMYAQPQQSVQQQPPAPAPMAAPDGMTPEQQALLARLTGAAAG